jgi:hypothetical protein
LRDALSLSRLEDQPFESNVAVKRSRRPTQNPYDDQLALSDATEDSQRRDWPVTDVGLVYMGLRGDQPACTVRRVLWFGFTDIQPALDCYHARDSGGQTM